jgi:hypothetical protein
MAVEIVGLCQCMTAVLGSGGGGGGGGGGGWW